MDAGIPGTAHRRGLMLMAAAAGASLAMPGPLMAAARCGGGDLSDVKAAIDKQRPEAIKRLQDWIALPSIAAEGLNAQEGAQYMAELLKDAGFQQTTIIQTDGRPGVFATMDNGSPRSVGMYLMYDVKQFDPSEWSSPPLEARIVDRPGLGKVMIGRGAVNQKGPEASFLAGLHGLRAAGRKPPVNIVLIAEGEEEIASPHFPQLVRRPEVLSALGKCREVWMPFASQTPKGSVEVDLGAKGVIEVELVCSTKAWGRGAENDIHSSYKAELDSAVWRLVKALSTLVSEDGNDPAIDDWFENVQPLTARQKELIAEQAANTSEAERKKFLGVQTWVRDLPYRQALERLASQPTVNIEGMYAGYTGPGGKTILPSKAVAKLDLRLVPNQTADEAERKLKAHLARRGYGDISVTRTGGYDPTQTDETSPVIQSALEVYRKGGLEVGMSPRLAGSWPGYIFTGPPVNLPAAHFGFGHGAHQHAPDEYYVIEAENPKLRGMAGASLGYVEFLYALAARS
ncbi:MAG: M20/M25/M40 family metallo-hydrolase [Phenylobacterium sp.]|uniref:M20/M25/M40 family metallo-hydrolase n=1 Tax=Phenylobacterium sp. TaxID=1871053 RepID=UPI0025D7BAA4|nr:M20/M25/M40 family metallo-hydrolase [Phenylobacterium sp.]MBI1199554.1 M20/M25/M40 family metallo-hydrolase [Phenylobacterium sp.]